MVDRILIPISRLPKLPHGNRDTSLAFYSPSFKESFLSFGDYIIAGDKSGAEQSDLERSDRISGFLHNTLNTTLTRRDLDRLWFEIS